MFGRTRAPDIFRSAALAGIDELDTVSESVTVRDLVTEQRRWDAPWYTLVGRADDDALAAMCAPVFGDLPLPSLTAYFDGLTELDQILLRIALANTLTPPLLVVGNLDHLTDDRNRDILLGRLIALGENQTVITATVNGVARPWLAARSTARAGDGAQHDAGRAGRLAERWRITVLAGMSLGTDLKRFSRGTMPRIALVTVILLPLLYGAMYLWAFWNPFGEVNKVPVALVNEDQGTVAEGQQVRPGNEVADALVDSGQLQLHRVSAHEAADGRVQRQVLLLDHAAAGFQHQHLVAVGWFAAPGQRALHVQRRQQLPGVDHRPERGA